MQRPNINSQVRLYCVTTWKRLTKLPIAYIMHLTTYYAFFRWAASGADRSGSSSHSTFKRGMPLYWVPAGAACRFGFTNTERPLLVHSHIGRYTVYWPTESLTCLVTQCRAWPLAKDFHTYSKAMHFVQPTTTHTAVGLTRFSFRCLSHGEPAYSQCLYSTVLLAMLPLSFDSFAFYCSVVTLVFCY